MVIPASSNHGLLADDVTGNYIIPWKWSDRWASGLLRSAVNPSVNLSKKNRWVSHVSPTGTVPGITKSAVAFDSERIVLVGSQVAQFKRRANAVQCSGIPVPSRPAGRNLLWLRAQPRAQGRIRFCLIEPKKLFQLINLLLQNISFVGRVWSVSVSLPISRLTIHPYTIYGL